MCFGAEWFKDLLIELVVLGGFIALMRLLLPWVLSLFGVSGGVLMQAINILIVMAVAIFIIVLVFDLFECFAGGFPLLRR